MRPLLVAGAPLGIFVVGGALFPLGAALALALAMFAATLIVAYLLLRFIRKFFRENCGPGGILAVWRPSVLEGLAVAVGVIFRWSPFGFASLVVFGANGLIVTWITHLTALGVDSLRGNLGDLASQSEQLAIGWRILLPESLEEAMLSASTELNSAADVLANLLVLLRYLLVVEGYVAWLFLLWLTTRSVLYFLARAVLAKQKSGGRDHSPIEVRFDMEFTR